MAAINFPNSPTEDQTFTPFAGGPVYVYNAPQWRLKEPPPPPPVVGGIADAPIDGKMYSRKDTGWTEIAWTTLVGKPATFPPTLPIAQSGITNLTSDLAGKAPLVHTHAQSDITSLVSDLAAKASLASPVFTGDPRAPTPTAGDNDTTLATTAFVTAAIAAIPPPPQGVPPGAVVHFATATAPTGWLKANGAALSTTTYAALFAAIGYTFGGSGGTFNVPDLRGEFIRVFDDARGIDAGRVFGSFQADGIDSHTHSVAAIASGGRSAAHTHVASGTTGTQSANHTHTFSDSSSATGTGSANHTHTVSAMNGAGGTSAGFTGTNYAISSIGSSSSGASHTHTVAVSGTTGSNSVSHTHTFSDTTTAESVDHTHTVPATNTGANTGAISETRPRNIALTAFIKY